MVFVTGLVVFSLQTQSFAVSTGVAPQRRQPLDKETCQTGLISYLVLFPLYTLFNCFFKCGLVCTLLRLSDVVLPAALSGPAQLTSSRKCEQKDRNRVCDECDEPAVETKKAP